MITPAEFLGIRCDLAEVVQVSDMPPYLCCRLTEYIWDKQKVWVIYRKKAQQSYLLGLKHKIVLIQVTSYRYTMVTNPRHFKIGLKRDS